MIYVSHSWCVDPKLLASMNLSYYTLAGNTSRWKNVPGQVKSRHTSAIDAIKQILPRLAIRTDKKDSIHYKQIYA